jgi:glutathione synthase/RimK-type ligase-like ATP-grasp enzyme
MRSVIYPYKMSSKSAKLLAEGLGGLRVYPNRNYRKRPTDLVINWGSSTAPQWGSPDLNATGVAEATNKLTTLRLLASNGVSVPVWTTYSQEAMRLVLEGNTLFCRTTLTGHAGQGIVVAKEIQDLVQSPLYTQSFPKQREFRIHVFNGSVIDVTEKRKRGGTGGREGHYVWNHSNDFVFAREGIECPNIVADQAVKAVQALGLDFGAVDIGWHSELGAVVFEVNTAPGITGTTLSKYVEAINEYSISDR